MNGNGGWLRHWHCGGVEEELVGARSVAKASD